MHFSSRFLEVTAEQLALGIETILDWNRPRSWLAHRLEGWTNFHQLLHIRWLYFSFSSLSRSRSSLSSVGNRSHSLSIPFRHTSGSLLFLKNCSLSSRQSDRTCRPAKQFHLDIRMTIVVSIIFTIRDRPLTVMDRTSFSNWRKSLHVVEARLTSNSSTPEMVKIYSFSVFQKFHRCKAVYF